MVVKRLGEPESLMASWNCLPLDCLSLHVYMGGKKTKKFALAAVTWVSIIRN